MSPQGPAQSDPGARPAVFLTAFLLSVIFWVWEYVANILSLPLALVSVAVAAAVAWALQTGTLAFARGLVRSLYAAGDIAPPPSYPRQEALIARGEYGEAAAYFRDHLVAEPADDEARLRLAALLEERLAGYDEAEALLRRVRDASPDPALRMRATNGLIDLYRKTNATGRLKAELARFAERWRGTAAGEAAARALAELKAAEPRA